MIEVIKSGKLLSVAYAGTCSHCGCVIRCLKEDVIFEDRPCAEGYVLCPTEHCTGHIVVRSV